MSILSYGFATPFCVQLSPFPRPQPLNIFGTVCAASVVALCGCGQSTGGAVIPPVADAGADFVVDSGATIVLDGSNSLDGTDPIDGYVWTLSVQPEGSTAELQDANFASASLVPDVLGIYVVTLVVSASGVDSTPDVVLVTANRANEPPNVVLGCLPDADCRVLHGQSAQLNSQLSRDAEDDPLTITWTQITTEDQCGLCPALDPCVPSSAAASIDDAEARLTAFTAPDQTDQALVFRAVLDDGQNSSSGCLVYQTFNTPPTVRLATSSQTINPSAVDENTAFTLDASPSFDADPADDDGLSITWSQVAGPALLASPQSGITIRLVAPEITGAPVDLVFEVRVSDGLEETREQITVSVRDA